MRHLLPILLAYALGGLYGGGVAWWQGPCTTAPVVAGPAQPWLVGVEGEAQTCTVVATGHGDVSIDGAQVRWTVYLPGVGR